MIFKNKQELNEWLGRNHLRNVDNRIFSGMIYIGYFLPAENLQIKVIMQKYYSEDNYK